MTEAAEDILPPELAAIDRVRTQVAAYSRVMPSLIAEICAGHFEVERKDIVRKRPDHSSDYGTRCAVARNCAMYLLSIGLDWSITRIAPDFGVRRSAASLAVSRVEELRDADPELDEWLASIEGVLNGHG